MKKLLLLATLLAGAAVAQAETVSVTVQGKSVANGETVDSHCLVTYEDEFMGMIFYSYQMMPEVFARAASDIPLQITVTNTSAFETPKVQFCWPSNCVPIDKGKSLTRDGVANNPADLGIDSPLFDEIPAQGLTLSCKIEIIPVDTPADKFEFNLNMVYDPAVDAVETVICEEAPAVYYDLSGKRVDNPEKGIYILRQGGSVKKVAL